MEISGEKKKILATPPREVCTDEMEHLTKSEVPRTLKRKRDENGCWIPKPLVFAKRPHLNEQNMMYKVVILPWLNLYHNVFGVRCSPTDDFRQFKAWLGVAPDVAEMVWQKYADGVFLKKRIHLAVVLNFLKSMPNQNTAAASFRITPPTYRKYLWGTINYLNAVMNEVCFLIEAE